VTTVSKTGTGIVTAAVVTALTVLINAATGLLTLVTAMVNNNNSSSSKCNNSNSNNNITEGFTTVNPTVNATIIINGINSSGG